MFTITEKAAGMLKDFLAKQQGQNTVRILAQPG